MKSWFSLLLVVVLVVAAGVAHAGPIASVGSNFVFEQAPDGRNYDIQNALNVRGGYRFPLADIYLEYSQFTSSTQVGVIATERTHSEWLAWGRYLFLKPWYVQPYLAAGLGVQSETIRTTFLTSSARDEGTPLAVGTAAAGVRALFFERLSLELEGRASFSRTYAPNPLLGVGLFLGVNF
jgi:hypothetical protein